MLGFIAYRFAQERTHFAARFRLVGKRIVAAFGDEVRHEQRYRREYDHRNGDKPVLRKHKDQRSQNGNDAGKQLLKTLQQPVGYLVDVVDDDGKQVAAFVCVDKRYGHGVQFGKRRFAQSAYCAVRCDIDEIRRKILEQKHRCYADCKINYIVCYAGEIDVARIDDVVDGVAYYDGREQRRRYLYDRA